MTMSTYGLSVVLLARLTGVHIETARRWKREGRIPKRYEKIIKLHTEGDLGALTGTWKGFRIRNGMLWTPEGDAVTPGDIRSIPYRKELIRELQRQAAAPKQGELF